MASHFRSLWSATVLAIGLAGQVTATDPSVEAKQADRVAVIAKARPAVVAVFGPGMTGGGSGVLIDKDGYALTNFHVVGGSKVMKCGLPNGILYDAVLVGLDKVGDVALIKLLPKKEGEPFPFAPLGDSDKVHEGDWSIAMGNPFLIATDFTPTVTFGLVSGVNRYQYPEGTLLEYTDCIQIDASINPGNSGGPLFNINGELIGINGRGSFDKRGRVNSGVGYAISINQIKNFLGHLRAGIDTDHATLGATIETQSEDLSKLTIREVLEEADTYRRGLKPGDELIAFAGRPMSTTNQYKNVLGIYPKEWRLPLTFRRDNQRKEVLVRLMPLQTKDLEERQPRPRPDAPRPGPPRPGEPPMPRTPPEDAKSPANKLYKAEKGFANYYFNELQQNRLMTAFKKHGDFSTLTGDWSIEGDAQLKMRKASFKVDIVEPKGGNAAVRIDMDGVRYTVEPLKETPNLKEQQDPPGSGGMLMALYHYRRLLTSGLAGFRKPYHGGHEPIYPRPADGSEKSLREIRVDAEVLRTEYGAVPGRWYFALNDQRLLAFEVTVDPNDDPCEVYCSDYRAVDGRLLPHRFEFRHGDERFAVITVSRYQLK